MKMACMFRVLAGLLAGLLLAAFAAGAEPAEVRAFNAAGASFRDGFYARAEVEFRQFALEFTNSARLPEATLFQAEARLKLTNYDGAVELLSSGMGAAGAWADQYQFWLGEALLAKGDNRGASAAFAKLVKEFPDSTNRLEAVVEQATALTRQADWAGVISLLDNGFFQAVARTNAANPLVPNGYLLLGEAHLTRGDYAAAEAALQPLAKLSLEARVAWQWQSLLCRIRVAQGKPEEALQNTSNLLMWASSAHQPALQADSYAFRAGILERLGRSAEAIAAYTNNLAEGFPPDRQREALFKIAELYLARDRLAEAAATLTNFLNQFPDAPAADLAWLTLGEFRLRLCQSATNGAVTNCLHQAVTAFEALTRKYPQSPFAGRGQLQLGWCLWLGGKVPESVPEFQAAIALLAPSLDQARAFFKLGDARFQLGDFAGAITNYNAILDRFQHLPEVSTNLFEPALYQAVRAAVAGGNAAAATNALARILGWYPRGYHTERAVLLTGQEISRQGDPAEARRFYADFLKLAPDAPLASEVQLAIAHTYEQETNWAGALEQYDQLLANLTNQAIRPQAEYYRAFATGQAGQETNALAHFTNFVARFPTNEFWPLAQWWIGDYYYRALNFVEAERNFQLIYQSTNWPASELTYQASMMAGRAAAGRQSQKDAIPYFTNLTANPNCPLDLRLEAQFAYGDALRSFEPDPTNKPLANLETAITVFGFITEYPSNRFAALAWGAKASCLLQWVRSSERFELAAKAFQQVTNSPIADAQARSIAMVGLALVLEKQAQAAPAAGQPALLNSALNLYLDVLYEKNLRDGEKSDLFWRQKTGMEAGRLAEVLHLWPQGINIYRQLQELLPSASDSLETKIRNARKNAGASGD